MKPQPNCPCHDLRPSDAAATERMTHRSAAEGERVCKLCHRVIYSAAWLPPRVADAAAMSWAS